MAICDDPKWSYFHMQCVGIQDLHLFFRKYGSKMGFRGLGYGMFELFVRNGMDLNVLVLLLLSKNQSLSPLSFLLL